MAAYSEFQPREYRRAISNVWWLGRWNYLKFILREFSSIFVAYYLIITLIQIAALADGPAAYADWQAWMREPLMIIWNIIAFIFLFFHAATWSNLVPKAMFPRMKGRRLPEITTAIPSYIIWLIASGVIAFLIMEF